MITSNCFLSNSTFLSRCDRESNLVSLPVLHFYTKKDCQLCDEALRKLAPILNSVDLQKVDISLKANEKYFGLYRYEIPVVRLETKSDRITMKNHEIDVNVLKGLLKK